MKLVILNNKTNLTKSTCLSYLREVNELIPCDKKVILCAPTCLMPYYDGKYNFSLGAQNGISDEIKCSGEASFKQLKSLNVKYSLIGHSDRCNILNESDDLINKNILSALKNNIQPILCVGETSADKELRKTMRVINRKIRQCLKNVNIDDNFIIAYEPVWAIGSGITPTNQEISEVVDVIKDIIFKNYRSNVKVVYGGSINSKNIKNLKLIDNLDGFLIGESSVKIEELRKIMDEI